MVKMPYEERKKRVTEILGDVNARSQRFLNTTYGAVVTSEAALASLRLHMGRNEQAVLDQKRNKQDTLEKLHAERKAKQTARYAF